MSTVQSSRLQTLADERLPLLAAAHAGRTVAWHQGRPVDVATFLHHVRCAAAVLPAAQHVVNLCEDRYAFLVGFCAALVAGQTNLLPPSRAPRAVAEVMDAHPGCYALADQLLEPSPRDLVQLPPLGDATAAAAHVEVPTISATHVAAVGYTSGSTGRPQANAKTWGGFHRSTAGTLGWLGTALGTPFAVVATVPPQHVFGLETSIVLPLLGELSVHAGRPFFPADVAMALAEVPAPRLLVTTPVHLRALLKQPLTLPPLAGVLSATAPMPAELAAKAEARFDAPLFEIFGSTETSAFAWRRSVHELDWTPYPDVVLRPQPDGTVIEAPQLPAPVTLADIVELREGGRFRLCGRNTDLLEIAGKRASLADLNRRLLAIPGVVDGVICQLDAVDAMGVRRLAALVVAPELSEAQVLNALRGAVDPVFLPRPLRRVPVLPRNETGKLPREALLKLLRPQR